MSEILIFVDALSLLLIWLVFLYILSCHKLLRDIKAELHTIHLNVVDIITERERTELETLKKEVQT